ncbi:MAG: Flp pilus assembly protein CpaB [Acidimicrobiales bacterium]
MAGERDRSNDRPVDRDDGRRRVLGRAVVPSARATVGGLLLALAGVATFVAWQQASGAPDHSYVVARRPLAPGERPLAEDLRLAPIDLPASLAAVAFRDLDAVVGRVALGPIGEDELLQTGQLSDAGAVEPLAEVSFALPRDRALDGRLRSGDLVDVFVTYPDQTTAVAEQVRVLGVSDGRAGFTDSGQVTVTLALGPAQHQVELIHAVRAGEVTLVRSTHAGDGATAGAAGGGGG